MNAQSNNAFQAFVKKNTMLRTVRDKQGNTPQACVDVLVKRWKLEDFRVALREIREWQQVTTADVQQIEDVIGGRSKVAMGECLVALYQNFDAEAEAALDAELEAHDLEVEAFLQGNSVPDQLHRDIFDKLTEEFGRLQASCEETIADFAKKVAGGVCSAIRHYGDKACLAEKCAREFACWKAFCEKRGQTNNPRTFEEAVGCLRHEHKMLLRRLVETQPRFNDMEDFVTDGCKREVAMVLVAFLYEIDECVKGNELRYHGRWIFGCTF